MYLASLVNISPDTASLDASAAEDALKTVEEEKLHLENWWYNVDTTLTTIMEKRINAQFEPILLFSQCF